MEGLRINFPNGYVMSLCDVHVSIQVSSSDQEHPLT